METYAVGVDIGGTKTALGLVDVAGRIVAEQSFHTEPAAGFGNFIDRLQGRIEQMLVPDLAGIGIGCPGPLELERGSIHNPYTLPTWKGCNLVEPLSAAFQTPVRLENDADAALLGEAGWGAARGVQDAVMLTLGTGVGGAVLKDGRIYRGTQGQHPELGHVIGHPDGPACYCGTSGCLEAFVSGTAIAAAGEAHGFHSSRAVFEAAQAGDARALEILERASAALDQGIWTILHSFLPEKIILGGGLIEAHLDVFLPGVAATIRKAELVRETSIACVAAELGNRAGLVGAARLILDVE